MLLSRRPSNDISQSRLLLEGSCNIVITSESNTVVNVSIFAFDMSCYVKHWYLNVRGIKYLNVVCTSTHYYKNKVVVVVVVVVVVEVVVVYRRRRAFRCSINAAAHCATSG